MIHEIVICLSVHDGTREALANAITLTSQSESTRAPSLPFIIATDNRTIDNTITSCAHSLELIMLAGYGLTSDPYYDTSALIELSATLPELTPEPEPITPPHKPTHKPVMSIGTHKPLCNDKRSRIEHLTRMRVRR